MSIDKAPTHPGIYQIRCLVNGKVYVGSAVNVRKRWRSHRSALDRNNHHSRYLQHAWKKHGADAFVFEILEVVEDKTTLITREQEWLDRLQSWRRNLGYNIYICANSALGVKHTAETRAKVSAALRRRKWSDEMRAKMLPILRGRPVSPEARAKISAARMGQRKGEPRSPEIRAKIAAAKKGKKRNPLTPEQKAALLAANLGRKLSDEHRAKISAANKGKKKGPLSEEQKEKLRIACTGWKHTPETLARMSAAQKGKYISPEVRARQIATRESRRRKAAPGQLSLDFGD